MRFLALIGSLCLTVVSCFGQSQSADNANVLRVARSFKDGGGYNKGWKGTGVPAEITYQGERILSCTSNGTYCCGYTFAVVMKAAAERGLLAGKTAKELRQFQKAWYGATPATSERTCAEAMKSFGFGQLIAFDDAQPGDFVQFWRGKSGHSVVFLNWVEEDGRKVGIHYRSSQGSTDGIGDRTEYFSRIHSQKDPINMERTYFSRLGRGTMTNVQ